MKVTDASRASSRGARDHLANLPAAIALSVCATIASAQQMQVHEVIRISVYKVPEKPTLKVDTLEPRQFGRNSVYAAQPLHLGNPLLAGGLTVGEGGGAPLYATQLTHPSGPVMEASVDVQPYGRDGPYEAGSPDASPLVYLVGRQEFDLDESQDTKRSARDYIGRQLKLDRTFDGTLKSTSQAPNAELQPSTKSDLRL